MEGVEPYRAIGEENIRGRLIFIGDIHGCYDELVELLHRVAPTANDLVVSVGDVMTKGPDAGRCLDLWRERGYLAVKGNNELKVLREATVLRYFSRRLRYVESWPLVLDFPSRRIAAVHGGFLPGMRVTAEDVERQRDVVPRLRWIRRKNGGWQYVPKGKQKKGDALWAEQWDGDRFVLYGHTPVDAPKRDARALGLDTGCVYGGMLTAAVFDGEWSTVSVPAKGKYA